jgi:hypothetical protein
VRASSYGAPSSCQVCRALRRATYARSSWPSASATAPQAASARAAGCAVPVAAASAADGLAVGRLRRSQVAGQAQQFGLLVARHAQDDGVATLLGVGAGQLDLGQRVGPLAAQLHDLGAVDQALPAEEPQPRLAGAPAAQRHGPLVRPPQVTHVPARDDDAAVDDAGDQRRDLVGRHTDHRLVQRRQAARDLCHRHQRLAAAEPAQCVQVGVAEPVGDPGDLYEPQVGGSRVPAAQRVQGRRDQQVAALGAVRAGALPEVACPGQPAARLRGPTVPVQEHGQPEGAADGGSDLPGVRPRLRGTLQRRQGDRHGPAQGGGERQPLEVVRSQATPFAGNRQLRVRLGPGPPGVRVPPPLHDLRSAHARSSFGAATILPRGRGSVDLIPACRRIASHRRPACRCAGTVAAGPFPVAIGGRTSGDWASRRSARAGGGPAVGPGGRGGGDVLPHGIAVGGSARVLAVLLVT